MLCCKLQKTRQGVPLEGVLFFVYLFLQKVAMQCILLYNVFYEFLQLIKNARFTTIIKENIMKKRILALLLSALMLLAAGCSSKPSLQNLSKQTIATLDGHSVSADFYAFFFRIFEQDMITAAMTAGYGTDVESFLSYVQDGKSVRDMMKEETFSYSKYYSLIHQKAVEADFTPSEESIARIDAETDDLLAQLGGDEAKFLAKYSLTPQEYKEVQYKLNLANEYQDYLIVSASVTPEEIQQAYEQGKELYDQVVVRHVLILCNDDMTEEEQTQAKAKAEDILKQVKEGADIGELAAQYSEDGGSSEENGEYTFPRGRMVEEFENWSFDANIGDQGMVKTDYGYHVIQKMGVLGFEDAKMEIEEYLRYDKASEQIADVVPLMDSTDWVMNQKLIDLFTVSAPQSTEAEEIEETSDAQ